MQIRYAVADAKRDVIPWVEYRGADGKVSTYIDSSAKSGSTDSLPRYTMECADCHNRAAHSFESAGHAVDQALASGELPVTLPFIRKNAIAILTASKDSAEIAPKLAQAYSGANAGQIESVAKVLAGLYDRNVFPDLKVTWGTYSNNLGHPSLTDSDSGDNAGPGCFRCHDGSHVRASDKQAIAQDCGTCHRTVAEDEASPEVLKTLGLN